MMRPSLGRVAGPLHGVEGSLAPTALFATSKREMSFYSPKSSLYHSLLVHPDQLMQMKQARVEKEFFLFRKNFEKPFLEEYVKTKEITDKERKDTIGLRRKLHRMMKKVAKEPLNEIKEAEKNFSMMKATDPVAFQKELLQKVSTAGIHLSQDQWMEMFGKSSRDSAESLRLETWIFQTVHLGINRRDPAPFFGAFDSMDDMDLVGNLVDERNEEKIYMEKDLMDGQDKHFVPALKRHFHRCMMRMLVANGLEVKLPEEVAVKTPKSERRFRPIDSDIEFTRVKYIEPSGNYRRQLVERRVKLKVKVGALGLPEEVRERLIGLAGLRYNPSTDRLKITSDDFPNKHQNTIHCIKLLKGLLEEAFLAHADYVPLSDLSADPDDIMQVDDIHVSKFVRERLVERTASKEEEEAALERARNKIEIPDEIRMMIADDSEYLKDDDMVVEGAEEEERNAPFFLFRFTPLFNQIQAAKV